MSSMSNTLTGDKPEGIYIPITDFENLSGAFYEAAKAEVKAYKEMEDAKEVVDIIGYQIELSIISEAGGEEKKVGTTEAARNRAYALAKAKSTAYKEAQEFYLNTKLDYRFHKHMLRLLDLRGQFIIASTK